jgi:predicted HTH domain antitoxin
MPLTIPDDVLKELKMNEREARIELACRLFDADKLSKPAASRLAELSRVDFEEELIKRGLPIIHYTEEMWKQDLEALKKMDSMKRAESAHR